MTEKTYGSSIPRHTHSRLLQRNKHGLVFVNIRGVANVASKGLGRLVFLDCSIMDRLTPSINEYIIIPITTFSLLDT